MGNETNNLGLEFQGESNLYPRYVTMSDKKEIDLEKITHFILMKKSSNDIGSYFICGAKTMKREDLHLIARQLLISSNIYKTMYDNNCNFQEAQKISEEHIKNLGIEFIKKNG